ncbi:MAG: hypothetical protein KIT87_13105, partial [Anaerolineae bacterium]|nr:hypothetical protein [Anaerolineae bacterium]
MGRASPMTGGCCKSGSHSPAFPLLSNDDATRFLRDSQTLKSTTWLRHVREWTRSAGGRSE